MFFFCVDDIVVVVVVVVGVGPSLLRVCEVRVYVFELCWASNVGSEEGRGEFSDGPGVGDGP